LALPLHPSEQVRSAGHPLPLGGVLVQSFVIKDIGLDSGLFEVF